MIEFSKLGYMDLQKTGSTWMIWALRGLLRGPVVRSVRHGPVWADINPDLRIFITCREPVAQYISLFKYGVLSQRGKIYGRLVRRGFEHLYRPDTRSLEAWLDYVLTPANAGQLESYFGSAYPNAVIGMMSARLIHVATPAEMSESGVLKSLGQAEVHSFLNAEKRYHAHVRTEHLTEDLHGLLTTWRDDVDLCRPLGDVRAIAERFPPRNTTPNPDWAARNRLSQELIDRINERERLYREEFGYDIAASGVRSSSISVA